MNNRQPSILLIDGRAGCGKTTLAAALAAQFGAAVVHMDDLTPGWNGLAASSDALAQLLEFGSAPRFDWHQGAFDGQITFDPEHMLIVEGCGSITPTTVLRASHTIWLDCTDDVRQTRALNRDGEMFAKFWQVWAKQEQAHLRSHQPHLLADIRLHSDGDRAEQDTLAECSKLLFSSQEVEPT